MSRVGHVFQLVSGTSQDVLDCLVIESGIHLQHQSHRTGNHGRGLAAARQGEIDLVTSMFFDIGVYLVVVGLALDVLRSLGAEVDRQSEDAEAGTASRRASGEVSV